ncbi:MAG TPA: response regulator transcription factor [Bacteroidia bacterium]|jgi:two-component system response regulator DegU|nr:response regulator transcription factor [Bacteroidia bacterium]
MHRKIEVAIADDHRLFRQGLISLLGEHDKNITITGETENGKKLLEFLKDHQPDVLLLDLDMPVMSGEEAFNMITKKYPKIKTIILSMFYNQSLVCDYMANGAFGYLRKECDVEILIDAIYAAFEGKNYFDADVSATLLKNVKNKGNASAFDGKRALSEREVEIIKHLCDGKTNRQIADSLSISLRTVDFHRGNIYDKTQAGNSAALAVYAVKHGIVSF